MVGSGGREHALVWKLSQSPKKPRVYCAPGNAGIANQARLVPIAATDVEGLLKFALSEEIDLTLVGSEAPLALGIVDTFKKNHLKIFGPQKEAARLESSKVFAKEFCLRHEIPQAGYAIFDNLEEAKKQVGASAFPLVIKADGLAAGKGVVVAQNKMEALGALEEMLVKNRFGSAGRKVVVEEFLQGEEASFIAVCDGNHVLPLASAKDHKRLLEGNLGPNTGGMGAFSPSPLVTSDVYEKVMETIMLPAVQGMVTDGIPFVGFLYAGLMICGGEPKLLEFNVRLGDPEAQAILFRLKTDLIDVVEAALAGRLNETHLSWETKASACIVMASKGYPEKSESGFAIEGLEGVMDIKDLFVFHSGTALKDHRLVTAGGRVLGVTALGKDLPVALDLAYEGVLKISWPGCQYRKDIGR